VLLPLKIKGQTFYQESFGHGWHLPERSFEGAFAACATSNPDFDQKSPNFERLKSNQIPICFVFDHF
jgi:hypothetical protein